MPRIVVDADLQVKLKGLTGQAELCDASGQVLGRFVPLIDLSKWEPLTPEIIEEELERRANSNEQRYTTSEVLHQLENL